MTRDEFRNEVARLRFIDHYMVPELSTSEYIEFRDNPYRFFCCCSDHHQEIIWKAMEKDREDQRARRPRV